METIKDFLAAGRDSLAVPASALGGTLILGWFVKKLFFAALHRWALKTRVRIDDLIVQAVNWPFMIWVLILGLYLAMDLSSLPPRASYWIGRLLLVLWITSFTLVTASLAGSIVRHYGRDIQGALPVTSLTENLAQLTVTVIGILVLLNMLGISITPILTALGVGGLAVALALQDTLANLFAGFYISVAGQIRLGDYIRLESGQDGFVTDIGWRATTIRALRNNMVIIPNSKLSQAIVTNYCLPEKRMSLLIEVGVSYDSDPETVERILIEEATKGAGQIAGLLQEPAPLVRFIPGFGDSSLNFTLVCQVGEFVDQFPVQHELRKRILARLRREGIEIPFPIRTVHLKAEEGSPLPAAAVRPA